MASKKPAKKKIETPQTLGQRLAAWLKTYRLDVLVASVLLLIAGVVGALNMPNSPQRFEDEGTYVSQAWAVQYKGDLAHYTYWYDHPPVAWIQLAGYTALTGAFDRHASSITAGREFMVVVHLVSVLLVFMIGRRLGIGRSVSALAAGLFALSPLAVEFSRYVLLDNIALPWLLGAFFLALTPRRHLLPIVGSAICMAVAILSKETFLIFLPALAYLLWQNSDKRNRRFMLASFSVVFIAIVSFYALYALLKNELFPGEGHVSLLGTLLWQLFGREGSGSILGADSDARNLFNFWMDIDAWLFWAGVAAMPFAWFVRSARPFVVALAIGLIMMLRGGYLPYPYIIALLPLAAIVIGAAVHRFVVVPLLDARKTKLVLAGKVTAGIAALALVAGFATYVVPAWQPRLQASMTEDVDKSSRQAVDWINKHVTRDKRMVVESALWTDLQDKGFNKPDPVWLYKTETDPEVAAEISGWQSIDYIVLNGPTLDERNRKEFPTVFEAKDHAKLVADFGQDNQRILVLKVDKSGTVHTPKKDASSTPKSEK